MREGKRSRGTHVCQGCHLDFLETVCKKINVWPFIHVCWRKQYIKGQLVINLSNIIWNSNFEPSYFSKVLKKIWPFLHFWEFGLSLELLMTKIGLYINLELLITKIGLYINLNLATLMILSFFPFQHQQLNNSFTRGLPILGSAIHTWMEGGKHILLPGHVRTTLLEDVDPEFVCLEQGFRIQLICNIFK